MEAPSPGAAVSGAGAKAVEAVRVQVCPRGLSPAGRGAPGRQGPCGLPPSAPLPLSLVGNRAPRWPTTATGDGRPSVPPAAAVLGDVTAPGPALALHCPRKRGRGQPAPSRRLTRCGPLGGPPRWGAAPRPTGGAARGGRGAGAPAWDARGGEKALFWPPPGERGGVAPAQARTSRGAVCHRLHRRACFSGSRPGAPRTASPRPAHDAAPHGDTLASWTVPSDPRVRDPGSRSAPRVFSCKSQGRPTPGSATPLSSAV